MNIEETGPKILEIVQQSKKILLHLHPRPDGDSVGSALAAYHVLSGMGKEVTVIKGDSPLPAYLSHLPGFDKIVPKNIFEIDLTEYDLFIIQDASTLGHVSTLGEIIFPPNLKVVCIDHHASNQGYVEVSLVDASYPSVCELLAVLYETWGVELTHDAALCLFVGMYTDTGGFRHTGTSSRSFEVAARLTKLAPDFGKIIFEMDNFNTKGKIWYEGLALSSVKTYLNDHVALAAVSNEELAKHGIGKEDAKSNIAEKLKSVAGWYIGISMVEEDLGMVKVSMRSRDGELYDVSKVAAVLGGGGHKAAAGCVLKMPIEEAKTKLIVTIEELYGKILVI